jgi:hypothetical protein|tara:strand:- start:3074 stop:3367 length:294 start_codon:yes stop_codon:yes gene_type:complete
MVPEFEINTENGPNPDNMIVDLNGFYIHMMDFIVNAIKLKHNKNKLCTFIDEDKNIFTSTLDKDGYTTSLKKCLVYFEKEEEFERCTIIKSLINERI